MAKKGVKIMKSVHGDAGEEKGKVFFASLAGAKIAGKGKKVQVKK